MQEWELLTYVEPNDLGQYFKLKENIITLFVVIYISVY